MLTSATALHSSVISFQMAVDHDKAQAHAATALAHLAALSSNQVCQAAYAITGMMQLLLIPKTRNAWLSVAKKAVRAFKARKAALL